MAPVRKGGGVSPHGNLAGVVNEFEVARDSLEFLCVLATLDADLEERIGRSGSVCVFQRHRCKFLVGRIERRRNVVGKENCVCDQMTETDKFMVLYMTSHFLLSPDFGRQDLPVVVGIVVRVSSHLLALAGNAPIIVAERVSGVMAMKIRLGLLVAESDGVVVVDGNGIGQHDIIRKCLLELGGHEVVTRARTGENGEVNLKPEQIEDEGHDDQPKGTRGEVLAKVGQAQATTWSLDVEQIPQVDDDSRANGNKGEKADVFG